MKPNSEIKQIKIMSLQLKAHDSILEKLIKNQPIQIVWVNKNRAAELYGVGPRTIYNWEKEGLLETKEICGRTYYSICPLVS